MFLRHCAGARSPAGLFLFRSRPCDAAPGNSAFHANYFRWTRRLFLGFRGRFSMGPGTILMPRARRSARRNTPQTARWRNHSFKVMSYMSSPLFEGATAIRQNRLSVRGMLAALSVSMCPARWRAREPQSTPAARNCRTCESARFLSGAFRPVARQ